jgi:G3E family GTPase
LRLLHELISRKGDFDYLIVETTGMADPIFLQNFFLTDEIRSHFYIDGVITVVDALNAQQHLTQQSKNEQEIVEAKEQIAVADIILLNKIDTVAPSDLDEVENMIKSINPNATLIRTSFSRVDLSSLLDRKTFQLDRLLQKDPQFLEFRPDRRSHDGATQYLFIMTHFLRLNHLI